MSAVLAITELKDGKLKKSSFEVASEAVKCGEKLNIPAIVLVIGQETKTLAEELKKYGADKIVYIEDENIKAGEYKICSDIVQQICKSEGVEYILFSSSVQGNVISAFVASNLGTSAISDCVEINIEEGELLVRHPVYSGKTIVTVKPTKKPIVLSLRPNVFPALEKEKNTEIKEFKVDIADKKTKSKLLEVKTAGGEKIELTEASVIVSGGRGMKSAENYKLLEELAKELGAAVGASRAIVDQGWRPHSEQVGQTGKTVSPQLYFAVGISGAIQHLAGMRTSKVIVAVNTDKDAPIFQVADYGIVGDALEVIPKITEEVKKLKG